MKNYILSISLGVCLLLGRTTFVQAQVAAEEIPVAVLVSPFNPLLIEANQQLLAQKLRLAISRSGKVDEDANPHFYLAADISLERQEVQRSITVQTVVVLALQLRIVDAYTKTTYAIQEMELKGIGESIHEAVRAAIRPLKAEDARIRQLLQQSRQKISQRYEQECEEQLFLAQQYIEKKNFADAANLLQSIPAIGQSCYAEVQRAQSSFNQLYKQEWCKQQSSQLKAALQVGDAASVARLWHGLLLADGCPTDERDVMSKQVEAFLCRYELNNAKAAFASLNLAKVSIHLAKIPATSSCTQEASQFIEEVTGYAINNQSKIEDWQLKRNQLPVSESLPESKKALLLYLF